MRPLKAGRASKVDADLTWDLANGPRYERVGKGLYQPVERSTSVEQRIVDAAARLPADGSGGFVTGWASLRWRGASYFNGRGPAGESEEPVRLALPSYKSMRPRDGVVIVKRAIGSNQFEIVDGLPVATVQRGLFDEIEWRNDLWGAVQAIDMTAAARLISVWLFAVFVSGCNSQKGAALAREACSYAVDESRSPREPWFRLVWELVARLARPLVNQPLYDLQGKHIGTPDLFDPVSGTAGEYSGEIHKGRTRHRLDVAREEVFRDHGLEYVEVVAGDSRAVAAARILDVRSRAKFLPPESCAWTLERPDWDPAPEHLTAYFERVGLAAALTWPEAP